MDHKAEIAGPSETPVHMVNRIADLVATLASLWRGVRALVVIMMHTVLALGAAACIRGFEYVWQRLFVGGEPYVADLFPMRWIFEFGEATVAIVFVFFGAVEAVRVFRGTAGDVQVVVQTPQNVDFLIEAQIQVGDGER